MSHPTNCRRDTIDDFIKLKKTSEEIAGLHLDHQVARENLI